MEIYWREHLLPWNTDGLQLEGEEYKMEARMLLMMMKVDKHDREEEEEIV